MSRRISLSALTVLDLSPAELVQCAADTGYDAVGLRLIPATPTERDWNVLGDTPMVAETLARLADTGIPVLDIEIVRLAPDTDIGSFELFLETGAKLGASQILVAGMDADFGRLSAKFAEFAELAEVYGLTPNLEYMPWTPVANLAQAIEVLADAGHPNVGLLVDSLHHARSHSDSALLADVPRSWLHYAQLCDAPAADPSTTEELIRQAREDRLMPGHGGLDLLSTVRALPADLPIGVEVPFFDAAHLPADIRAASALDATRAVLAAADHTSA